MNVTINDYNDDPFRAVREFEQAIAEYTGAPYSIATDSCTHAIELCLRLIQPKLVSIPSHTYLSIPMTLRKLNIEYMFHNENWYSNLEYNIKGTNIWDSARKLQKDMYREHTFQCLSFGYSKPLEIGRGGMILLDNKEAYEWLRRASYDGRNLEYKNWEEQKYFQVGYHYNMRPEEAIKGLNLWDIGDLKVQGHFNYPNLNDIVIQ